MKIAAFYQQENGAYPWILPTAVVFITEHASGVSSDAGGMIIHFRTIESSPK